MATKFDELATEYSALFDELNDSKRTGNKASDMNVICAVRPTWGRNEAFGFQTYAIERAMNASHTEAMSEVNTLQWR